MKKNTLDTIKTVFFIILLVVLTKVIGVLPWWSFIVPVLLLGVVISLRGWKVSCFGTGFISGFGIWFVSNLFFDMRLGGAVLGKIGLLLSVPGIVVLCISGVIGGLLTGLALYTGKVMVSSRDIRFSI